MSQTSVLPSGWRQALAPATAAVAAFVLGRATPYLGPLLVGMLLGIAVANSRLAASRLIQAHATTTRAMLRLGVVALGFQLSLGEIGAIGPAGIAIVVLTTASTHTAARWLGGRLRLDPRLVELIAAGFAVCGAAAIAAVNDAVRARREDVALALALVTVFGTLMIAGVPAIASVTGLDDRQAAMLAGASIHEVAQVAAAAAILGAGAVPIAMSVKLGRVLLLAPLYTMTARRHAGPLDPWGHRAVPWFVPGFVLAVGVSSLGMLPAPVLAALGDLAVLLLAGGMFGLGLGIDRRGLWPIPWPALVLATATTAVAVIVPLGLILGLRP